MVAKGGAAMIIDFNPCLTITSGGRMVKNIHESKTRVGDDNDLEHYSSTCLMHLLVRTKYSRTVMIVTRQH